MIYSYNKKLWGGGRSISANQLCSMSCLVSNLSVPPTCLELISTTDTSAVFLVVSCLELIISTTISVLSPTYQYHHHHSSLSTNFIRHYSYPVFAGIDRRRRQLESAIFSTTTITTTIRHYQPTSYDSIRILYLQGSTEEGDN
jgi:hypothetical protein